MNNNAFQLYEQLRAYQLHCNRMESRNTIVPSHFSYCPSVPKFQNAKMYHKYKKNHQIESQNQKIMNKLISINNRKPQNMSSSTPLLPPLKKKQLQMPIHSDANSRIANKIINCKPSIDLKKMEKNYRTHQQRKNNISRFERSGGVTVNRKKYMAELMLLKKLKTSTVANQEV